MELRAQKHKWCFKRCRQRSMLYVWKKTLIMKNDENARPISGPFGICQTSAMEMSSGNYAGIHLSCREINLKWLTAPMKPHSPIEGGWLLGLPQYLEFPILTAQIHIQ